jgi:hypothetical protein
MGLTRYATCLAAALAPSIGLAAPAPSCISAIRIDRTEVVDDSTILFHMLGHEVYRNTLPQRCVGLRLDPQGFTYSPTDNSDALCSNLVTIRLNSYGSVCMLGAFVRVK